MRGEDGSLFASDVLWLSVVVTDCVLDLRRNLPVSTIIKSRNSSCTGMCARVWDWQPTCMLTVMPSPLCPLMIAVTTTSVSFPTKFCMHRHGFCSWPACACRSNLRAWARETNRRTLQAYCSSPLRNAIVLSFSPTIRWFRARRFRNWGGGKNIGDLFFPSSLAREVCASWLVKGEPGTRRIVDR